MGFSNEDRSQVLIEALPYIQKYNGKIVVIKYGGHAMLDRELKKAVMGDIVLLTLVGMKVVLVHGGGPEISDMLTRLGKESEFVDGLRVTDRETVDVVQMVLCGKVNKDLCNYISSIGGRAMGLSGLDDRLIEAEILDERLGYVGRITKVNPQPIFDLLDRGYIPVISTVAGDAEGNVYNINADTAASRIAGVLGAESLISMTDTRGILREKDDESTLISEIRAGEAPSLIESGVISGGMIPKVESCIESLKLGVRRVFIIDGRVPHAVLIETLTDSGVGTMFTQ